MIPSPLSSPGSEAKEKCFNEKSIGKIKQEAIRKRPHCLKQNAFPDAAFFGSLCASEIHLCDSVSHCALVLPLVLCESQSPQKQEMLSF
jgi:hypothetical protein